MRVVFAGSSKRPPQGPRKEAREVLEGKAGAEGAGAEDDMDSDEEKKLGATDLGALPCFVFGSVNAVALRVYHYVSVYYFSQIP